MTVIAYPRVAQLFPNYSLSDSSSMTPFSPLMGRKNVFNYLLTGKPVHGVGLNITAVGQFRVNSEEGQPVDLGGPSFTLELRERGERDAQGQPGLTVHNFWDTRGESIRPMRHAMAEYVFASNVVAVKALCETLGEIATVAELGDKEPLLADCVRQCPEFEHAAYSTNQRRLTQLRRNVFLFAEMLMPEYAIKALNYEAGVTPPIRPWRDGEQAPGGGATVLSLQQRRPRG